jgi:hypothetical protein
MEEEVGGLLVRSSSVRDEFDLSASDKLKAASAPMSLSVMNENEAKQHVCLLLRSNSVRDVFDLSASDNMMAP